MKWKCGFARLTKHGISSLPRVHLLPKLSLTLFTCVVLSACGTGSSSGSSEPSTQVDSPTQVTQTDGALSKPVLELQIASGVVDITWTDTQASGYRVLYWFETEPELNAYVTNGSAYNFMPDRAGTYTFIVEAYDELGNSIFSDAQQLEVSL